MRKVESFGVLTFFLPLTFGIYKGEITQIWGPCDIRDLHFKTVKATGSF